VPLPGKPGSCRLIINADDFGWSEGVNEAVCALYDAGVVTSTSLMVGAPAARHAIECAKARPGLAMGLHLVLVHGPALLPLQRIPHLVDHRGWFSMDCVRAGLRYTFVPPCWRELREEIQAQCAAFASLGVPWSHVDAHLHFLLTIRVFLIARQVLRSYPITGFRIPLDDFALYRRTDTMDARAQCRLAVWFELLCGYQRWALRHSAYVTPKRCYGLFRTGRLTPDYLAGLVRAMPDGDLELHCHPDLSTPSGRWEYRALLSDPFRAALAERGVELTTYAGLARQGAANE
jgi:hopanoid biosynthesis associated protein HpnK